jgi:hypothetical protein
MKHLLLISLLIYLTSCGGGTYSNRSGDNSNLSFDSRFCKSLARSRHPGYICKNPLMCTMEETNIVINDLTQYYAVFQNCMYSKNYDYQ